MSHCSALKHRNQQLLYISFFFSGCAALIYQLAWQRVLLTLLGMDYVSISIVVAAFMMGLGCGSLIGGIVGDYFSERLIKAFFLCEALIAAFGIFSVKFLDFFSAAMMQLHWSLLLVAVFFLLLIPTILMGATLPILITYLVKRDAGVGAVTGKLYAVNTLGGAFGAFTTGFFFFVWVGLTWTVYVAVLGNVISSISIWLYRGYEK